MSDPISPEPPDLREAAQNIAEGRWVAVDGETCDEWCFFCDSLSGHASYCTFVALRAALAATKEPTLDDVRLDALDHHAGWCSCAARGWLADKE